MGAMQMGAAGIRVRIGHYEDGTLKKKSARPEATRIQLPKLAINKQLNGACDPSSCLTDGRENRGRKKKIEINNSRNAMIGLRKCFR